MGEESLSKQGFGLAAVVDAEVSNPYVIADQCGIDPFNHPRVGIDWKKVVSLAATMRATVPSTGARAYSWNDPKFWSTGEERWIRSQLLTVGNALNFRFWRRSDHGDVEPMAGILDGERHTGSMYMWRRLRLAFDEDRSISSAEFLAAMTPTSFDALFSDDDGFNPLSVAIDERVANLRDLGEGLLTHWDGRFSNLLKEADGSLPRFVALSSRFRAFDDPLAKLTFVNGLMQKGSGLAEFQEQLLPAIDYQIVKQLLRQGVLAPDLELSAKLVANAYLDQSEALELRTAAMDALLGGGAESSLPGDYIDNQLWRNRVICTETAPRCNDCPFSSFCSRDIDFQRPLQITRYY